MITVWNLFESHIGIQVDENRQKRETNDSKTTIKGIKNPKSSILKKHKNNEFFNVFDNKGLSRKPQEAEEGSQKAPKKSKTPKNRYPKLSAKNIKKIGTNFGAHSETQAQPKKSKKTCF